MITSVTHPPGSCRLYNITRLAAQPQTDLLIDRTA
jgi:hypothetical protein